ncbi:hypothetical protein EXU85_11340 [Spirosoma sp. KCTC 42546]|uniref:hypothetical protein n=1 Tax=Spirosoma sp. KCTC 42546 TaxID=2520506 RepID=UPI001159E7C3|nr:hypothetical protein [Spirosoma sp. KCTC 42546]QDK79167.1 hypothetical protein EXU85_11340 [Spirosoma sp. KCTC 42546]
MRNHYGRRRLRFFFPVFILMALFFFSFAVYWLWNKVLVAVVPVKVVTYWQAMGLLILSRILLGGVKAGPGGGRSPEGGGPPWREKFRQMSDEDRAKFKNEWRRRGEDRS